MFGKKVSNICLLVFLLSLAVLFTGCGYQGNLNVNQKPEVIITSFTGRDTREEAYGLDSVVYQQNILWYGKDVDGTIKGYAYRILREIEDTDGNITVEPITTAGNEFIYGYLPELAEVDTIGKGGWIKHYQKGASEEYPLDDSRSQTTVWTEDPFVEVNFPASDEEGGPTERKSWFEVVAIDNRGALSKVERRYFFTKSDVPDIVVTTSKGALYDSSDELLDDEALGRGVRMIFSMPDQRIGVAMNKAWYYRYRIFRMNGDALAAGADSTTWYTTQYYPNFEEVVFKGRIQTNFGSRHSPDPDEVWDDVPALVSNFDETPYTRNSYTVIDVQTVDMGGVRSEPVRKYFLVSHRFNPKALFYLDKIFAYGNSHYTIGSNPDFPRMIVEPPVINAGAGTRYAQLLSPTPLLEPNVVDPTIKELTGFEWQLVGDASTKFWIRWGYHGEFPNDNPNSPRMMPGTDPPQPLPFDIVRDSETSGDYGSEISSYYISLDGMRYQYAPLMVGGLQNFTFPDREDLNGTEYQYLKVNPTHEIAQQFVRTGLTPGRHVVTILVEDLQDAISKPDSLVFKVKAKKSANERNGVLYIDFSATNTDTEAITNIRNFYSRIFSDLQIEFTYVNRSDISEKRRLQYQKFNSWRGDGNRIFPASMLNEYKYVIIATDLVVSGEPANIARDAEGIASYLDMGGTVILVGNNTMNAFASSTSGYVPRFVQNYFGFPDDNAIVSNSGINNYYLAGANPTGGDLPTLLPNSATPPEASAIRHEALRSFSPILKERENEWLNPTLANNIQVLYRITCKPVGNYTSPTLNITDTIFDRYNGSPIAFKYTPRNSSQGATYTFLFPLYHMQQNHVRELFRNIMR